MNFLETRERGQPPQPGARVQGFGTLSSILTHLGLEQVRGFRDSVHRFEDLGLVTARAGAWCGPGLQDMCARVQGFLVRVRGFAPGVGQGSRIWGKGSKVCAWIGPGFLESGQGFEDLRPEWAKDGGFGARVQALGLGVPGIWPGCGDCLRSRISKKNQLIETDVKTSRFFGQKSIFGALSASRCFWCSQTSYFTCFRAAGALQAQILES